MIRRRAQLMLMTVAIFAAACARADEFDTLRTRWRDMLTQGTNASFGNPLYQNWINSVGNSAYSYWNSLSTSPGRTYLWSAYSNLTNDSSDISGSYSRLRTMALAYAVNDSAYKGNPSLLTVITNGLDWLYTNHYNEATVVFDNWFDFEIATPLLLNDITALLYSNLAPAQITSYMGAVDHFTPDPDYSVISSEITAANKIWKSLIVGVRGTLVKDAAKIDLARLAMSDVFPYVTTNDGFYADGSFIFHNYFPYNAGYGVELLDSTGALMQLLQGSSWQITDPAHTNVFRWVYDSFQPFIVRGAAMEMVDGRYHTRNGNGHERGHELLGAILRIAQVAPPTDAAAFKSFVKGAILADTYRDFVTAQSPPYNVWASAALNDTNLASLAETTEHRQFPGMDRVIHRTPGWTFGLAMSSRRVANYESTRGENLHGWFTGDGMTYLYNADQGHYSDNFWSTVDSYRMPGTTIENYPRADGFGDAKRGLNSQVGGASIQGTYGVAAMHLDAYNSLLSARKSWFMFDNEIVCLGNSISDGTNGAVETIIENRRLGVYGNNPFTVNGSAKPGGPGWSETMAGTSWAHLAGTTVGSDVGYYFPQLPTLKVVRESRSGAMKDINTTYGSSTRQTRHYLTMYFDHGTNPSSSTYSYVLLPGRSASAVAAYAAAPDITVVQNNSIATLVRENKLGITAVNYWRDTNNPFAGISIDRKAAAIWHNDGSVLEIGVSDPTQTNTAGITVELTNTMSGILSLDPGVVVLQMSPLKLWFNTPNTFGRTLRARFGVAPVQTSLLSPSADTHVQNGASAATNFGESQTVAVKLGSSSTTREAYLRFDLSSIPGTIVGANLRLVTRSLAEPVFHTLALVPDNSWAETGALGITWNTKPASGAAQATWPVAPLNLTSTVPITALAQAAHTGAGQLSLRIFSNGTNSTGPTTSSEFVSYGAKENNTAANRPQLTITYLRTPPTVRLSSPEDGAALEAPSSVTLTAEAQDPDGVVSLVEFYSGATRIGQLSNAVYTMVSAPLVAGNYTFTAVATDNSGLKATSGPVSVSIHLTEPPGLGTGLVGEYYSGDELKNLSFTRTDPTINFFWGSVTNPVANEHFSVRWIGKLQAQRAGLHLFHADTDDGVRLWIDGRLIVDNWNTHPPFEMEDTGSISLVPGRYYSIVMEYFDDTSTAVARLYWTPPGGAKEIIPQSQLYPADQGLKATYFFDIALSTRALTRIDDTVNFFWNTNSPDPTTMIGTYGARWTGKVKARAAGQYQFFTSSDDAVRLWINGQLIISNWTAHALTEDSGTITLPVAGQYYDVMMEYYNAGGAGTAVLSWQPPGDVKEVIPPTNLTAHQNNNPPTLALITNRLATPNTLLTFTVGATDPDVPAQLLTYSLDAGAPAGAAVHPTSGVFSWTPSNSQSGPHVLTLRITDNGSPLMTDAQTFSIMVLTNPTVSLVRSGTDFVLTWPQSAAAGQLYSATNLAPPVTWLTVSNTPFLTNGQWVLPLSAPADATRFYRLQTP